MHENIIGEPSDIAVSEFPQERIYLTDSTNHRVVILTAEIDKLLSMTLIANLGTTDDDGSIHLMPMWFVRIGNEICIPTSHSTHKYRNLRARPCASVMIDVSNAGLNLKGELNRGSMKLVDGVS